MIPEHLWAFVLVVAAIVTSPGPTMIVVARALAAGREPALAATAGVVLAVPLHGAAALAGVGAILATSAVAFAALKLLGGAYLAWLGIKALRAAWRGGGSADEPTGPRRPMALGRAFRDGLAINLLNPKPALFYLAAFAHFVDPGPDLVAQALFLNLVHAALAGGFYLALIFGAGGLARALWRGPARRRLDAVSGSLMVAFGLRLATLRAT